jgi:hypothetical protein
MKNKKRKNKNYTEKVKTGKFANPASIWKEALNQGLIKQYADGGDLAKLFSSFIPVPGVPQAVGLAVDMMDKPAKPINTTPMFKEGGELRGISQYVGANHANGGIPIGKDGEVTGLNAVAEAEGGEYKVKFNNLPDMKGTNYIFPSLKKFQSAIKDNLEKNSKYANPDTDQVARNTIEMNFKKLMMQNENRKAKEELNTKQFGEGGKLKYSAGGFPPFESMFGALRTMMAPQVSSLGNYGRFSRYKDQLESGTTVDPNYWNEQTRVDFNAAPGVFMPVVEGRPKEDALLYDETTEKRVAGTRLSTMALTGIDPFAVIKATKNPSPATNNTSNNNFLFPFTQGVGAYPFDDASGVKEKSKPNLDLTNIFNTGAKALPTVMRATGLGLGAINALQKAQVEQPVMPNYNQADRQFENMSSDLTQARQDAQASTNAMSNVNRSASTGFGQYRARQSANYANLADQLGRIGMQEQQMRNQIAQTRGSYEFQKAITDRNTIDENNQRNLANEAMRQDFTRLFASDLVAEADRLSTQSNMKDLAEMNTQLGKAYLETLAPDVTISWDMVEKIQKVGRGEIDASELNGQELLVYKKVQKQKKTKKNK